MSRLILLLCLSTMTLAQAQDKAILPYAEKATPAQIEILLAKGPGAVDGATDSLGRTLLECAAATGSVDLVKRVVALKVNVNETDKFGGNALGWAVYGGNLPCIKYLRSIGIPYNARSLMWMDTIGKGGYFGSTLNCAAGKTNVSLEAVKYLIDSCKADVNELENSSDDSHTGWAPVHWAVSSKDTAKLALIISRKARLNLCSNEEGATPLSLAIADSNTAAIAMLLQHGASLAYDSATGNQFGSLGFLVHALDFDTGIALAVKYGVKRESRVAEVSSVTLLALAEAGSESCFDTVLSLALKNKKKITDGFALLNALYQLKPSLVAKLYAAGAPFGTVRAFLSPPDDQIFGPKKLIYPGASYEWEDTLARGTRDSLLCECIKILDRPVGSFFTKDQQRNALFTACVKYGFSRCANYLLDQGVPLPCVQDDETDLFSCAMSDNDSLLVAKMAKNHGRVTANSFLFSSDRQCSCGTLAEGLAIARGQQIVDTNRLLLRNALISAVKSGCPDLVKSLYLLAKKLPSQQAVSSDSSVQNDSLDNTTAPEGDDTLKIDNGTLLADAVKGACNAEVVRFFLDKKVAPSDILSIFSEPNNLATMTPEVFELLVKQAPSKLRKAIDNSVIVNFGHPDFKSPAFPLYLMKRYRSHSSEPAMIGLIYSALYKSDADSLFSLCGFPASRKEMRILSAACLLRGDTARVSELTRKGIKLPAHGKEGKPLMVECIINGNEPGFAFLEKQGHHPGKSAIKKLYLAYMNNLLERENSDVVQRGPGSVTILEKLFTFGAKIDWTGNDHVPMIRKALESWNIPIARTLVAHGASPQSTDSVGRTALYFAIDADDTTDGISFVKLLLARGARADMLVDQAVVEKNRRNKLRLKRDEELSGPADEEDLGIPKLATQSPLQLACSKGKTAIVRLLIGAGATPDHQDTDGTTPLMEAALTGNHQCCSLLVAAGANVELQTNDDVPKTALGMALENNYDSCAMVLVKQYRDRSLTVADPAVLCNACKNGSPLPLILDLVSIGCDINGRDNDGQTPVFKTVYKNPQPTQDSAFIRNYDRIFNWLLQQKADLSVVDNSGKNLLAWAISEEDSAKTRYFLSIPSLINGRDHTGTTPLLRAVNDQNVDYARLLLDHKADPQVKDNEGNTALHVAVTNNDTPMVALLLNRKVEVNIKNNSGKTPLFLAAEKGNQKLSELLLKYKADVKIVLPDGTSLLHIAAGHGDTTLTRFCLKAGLDINSRDAQGETPLLKAVKNDVESTFICRLIKEGADPSVRNNDNESVLHVLAMSTTVYPCLEQIIAAIKEIDAVDNEGKTPLLSSSTAATPLFGLLLKKGASLTNKDNDGNTALALAAGSNRNENLALVLGQKPPSSLLEAKNNEGKTALMRAVAENNYIGAMLLLNAGASTTTADGNGETPLKLAASNDNPTMINALRRHGAVVRGGKEKIREYAGQNGVEKETDRLIELLSMPVEKLPMLPAADFKDLEGYWWRLGSMPLSGFHTKECVVVKDSEKTLETTDEVLKFTPYSGKILSKENLTNTYGLQSSDIVLRGDKIAFHDNEDLCDFSKEGQSLVICSPSREICYVYRFAGKTFDEEGFNKKGQEKGKEAGESDDENSR